MLVVTGMYRKYNEIIFYFIFLEIATRSGFSSSDLGNFEKHLECSSHPIALYQGKTRKPDVGANRE